MCCSTGYTAVRPSEVMQRRFLLFSCEQVKTLCLWFNDIPLQNQSNFGQSVSLLTTFYNLQSFALWVIFSMSSTPFFHQTPTFLQVKNRLYCVCVCVCSSLSFHWRISLLARLATFAPFAGNHSRTLSVRKSRLRFASEASVFFTLLWKPACKSADS